MMNKPLTILFNIFTVIAFLGVLISNMAFAQAEKKETALEKQSPVLAIQQVVSDKGIRAWLVEDHSLPIVAMKIGFKHGSSQDPEGKSGVSQLLSNTLDEGAGPYDSKEFQKRLNDRSITLNFDNGRDGFYANLKTLSKNKEEAFALLKLALTKPLFEEEALERMKEANIARIKSSLSRPEWIIARLSNDRAYEGHVYARNSGGTISSLDALTKDDLESMRQAKLTRENIRVAVTGDMEANELKMILDLIFGDLPETQEKADIPDLSIQNRGKIYLYEKDIAQSFIEMVWDGVGRDDPDYFAAVIMNHILGGAGFGSILMEEVREKRGLTYGIYSSMQLMDHAPSIKVKSSTSHDQLTELMRVSLSVIEGLKEKGPTDKQLEDAKNYLIGSLPLELTSTSDIASISLGLQMDDLAKNYLDKRVTAINNVTKEDVQAVAQRLFKETPLTILVGKPELPEELEVEMLTEIPNAE